MDTEVNSIKEVNDRHGTTTSAKSKGRVEVAHESSWRWELITRRRGRARRVLHAGKSSGEAWDQRKRRLHWLSSEGDRETRHPWWLWGWIQPSPAATGAPTWWGMAWTLARHTLSWNANDWAACTALWNTQPHLSYCFKTVVKRWSYERGEAWTRENLWEKRKTVRTSKSPGDSTRLRSALDQETSIRISKGKFGTRELRLLWKRDPRFKQVLRCFWSTLVVSTLAVDVVSDVECKGTARAAKRGGERTLRSAWRHEHHNSTPQCAEETEANREGRGVRHSSEASRDAVLHFLPVVPVLVTQECCLQRVGHLCWKTWWRRPDCPRPNLGGRRSHRRRLFAHGTADRFPCFLFYSRPDRESCPRVSARK